MAKLTQKDVEHVAKLAQIKLSKEEVKKYKEQLSDVISYIEELNEVDTANTQPTSQTTGLENITREDEIQIENHLTQDRALSGTEKVHNNYFKIPPIFEP